MHLLTRLDRALAKTEEVILALLLVGMVLLASLQVLLRNVWDTGLDWADISLQHLTLLLGLLGAAIATSEGRHLNIDLFSRALKGRAQYGLRVLLNLFSVVACGFLVRGGWQAYQATLGSWKDTIPTGWTSGRQLGQQLTEGTFPPWLAQLALPLGFGLVGFHFLLRLVRDAGSLVTNRPWELKDETILEGDAALDEMERQAGGDGHGGEKR